MSEYKSIIDSTIKDGAYRIIMDNIGAYRLLKDMPYDSRHKTMSAYIRERLTNNNIIEQSNGESALMFL